MLMPFNQVNFDQFEVIIFAMNNIAHDLKNWYIAKYFIDDVFFDMAKYFFVQETFDGAGASDHIADRVNEASEVCAHFFVA